MTRTKQYIARLERREPIDRGSESELVELRVSTSVHIRKTDPGLARKLKKKADYWTNPEHWSNEEVVENEIQINNIAEQCGMLLSDV